MQPAVVPTSPLAAATRYDATCGRPPTAFRRDPNLPPENTFAARTLRAQALGRTNGLFAVGHEAAEHTAVACTLVQTAELHGVDVLAHLPCALERVAACQQRPGDYAALPPMADQEAPQRAGDGTTVTPPALRGRAVRRRAPRMGGGTTWRRRTGGLWPERPLQATADLPGVADGSHDQVRVLSS